MPTCFSFSNRPGHTSRCARSYSSSLPGLILNRNAMRGIAAPSAIDPWVSFSGLRNLRQREQGYSEAMKCQVVRIQLRFRRRLKGRRHVDRLHLTAGGTGYAEGDVSIALVYEQQPAAACFCYDRQRINVGLCRARNLRDLVARPEVLAQKPECPNAGIRSEEHTSELQSPCNLVCRLLLEKKKKKKKLIQLKQKKKKKKKQKK